METKNNITEDYVSYETAQLLKQKGFDAKCSAYYISDDEIAALPITRDFNNNGIFLSAPTLQMACKWLRNVYNIIISISVEIYESCDDDTEVGFGFAIQKKKTPDVYDYIHHEGFDTHEEATEAAIKYCLTELIK